MSSRSLPRIRAAASAACSRRFLTFSAGHIDMLTTTKLRVARSTDDLEAVAKFYREGLGFVELYRFADHDGFDGVMLGLPAAPYHLEFTRAHGHRAGRAPTQDNLLVFYLPDATQWQEAVARFK